MDGDAVVRCARLKAVAERQPELALLPGGRAGPRIDLGAAAQHLVADGVHVTDDQVRAVALLNQRVRAAVDADLVVTAQNVGNDATIDVFDHDGEPIATGRTPSVRAGMITDSGVILVTVDGAVVTMSPSSGETSDGAQINLGTIESGDVTTSGDRLVVTGANGVAIIGGDGAVIGTYDAQRPAGAGQPPVGSTCIATITAGDVTETQLAVIDATDGSVRVEGFGDEPLLADASGCVVGAQTATGFDLLTGDRVQPFRTNDTLLALTLDGASVVAEHDGRTILFGVGVDAEADDPIDLGPQGRTVHITQS